MRLGFLNFIFATVLVGCFTACKEKTHRVEEDSDTVTLRYAMTPMSDTDPANNMVVNIVEARLMNFGIGNPEVRISESDGKYLEVNVPEDADTAVINRIVTAPGLVTFYPTVTGRQIGFGENYYYVAEAYTADQKADVDRRLAEATDLPEWIEYKWYIDPHAPEPEMLYGLDTRGEFSPVISEASVEETERGPQLSLIFDGESAKAWENMTRCNIGKQIAILIDGKVVSAPRVMEPISGGRSLITGSFTHEELQAMAAELCAANPDILLIPVR